MQSGLPEREGRANGPQGGMVCIIFTTVKAAKTPWEAGQVPCRNVQVTALLRTLHLLLPWQWTPLNHNGGSRKQPALPTSEALTREECSPRSDLGLPLGKV